MARKIELSAGGRPGLAAGLVCATLGVLAVVLPERADAAFPGANGKLAYTGVGPGSRDVFTVNPDGSNPTNLTQDTAEDRDPVFSADAARIAFSRVVSASDYDIVAIEANGSNPVNLTAAYTSLDLSPAFSPGGAKIAFSSFGRGGPTAIWEMGSDGSNPQDLQGQMAFESGPVYSPDGSKIAFSGANFEDFDIWSMNADGSDRTDLTPDSASADLDPAFSPDGTKIAFTRDPSGSAVNDIYVIDAVGAGTPVNLTPGTPTSQDRQPAFSPDGTKIAFASNRDGGDYDIFVSNADGSNPVNITPASTGDDMAPDWGTGDGGGGGPGADTTPPETSIEKAPKKKTEQTKAKLKFSSDEAGSAFECRLKGKGVKKKLRKFKPCSATAKYAKLVPGKKKFQVRAIDAAGNVDPTPAKHKWKVLEG